jgi:DNA repair exonuclease SbcCD ATPase subunit
LEDRENTLTQKDNDRSAEWEKKMKEVQERQDALAQEEKDRAESYEKKLQELQSREAELAKKEEQKSPESGSSEADKPSESDDKAHAEKEAEREHEADIQRKLDDLKSTEQKIAADRASLGKSKADFTEKLEWFRQRQKSFEDQKSSAQHDAIQARKNLEQRHREVEGQVSPGSKKASQHQNSQNGIQDGDVERKERENAELEKRLAKLEDQLAHMSASTGKAENTKVNGAGSKGVEGCGYRHYKPPRKINKKVIGFVYA